MRILHLEGDPLGAERVHAVLCRSGLECDIRLVDTQEDFRAALDSCRFDAILADYSLPEFDGLSALRMSRQVCPQSPFLFVSGPVGEERVVEALKAGAVDYVLKHHLERLVPSLQRALREAADRAWRKLAEQSLRESERRLGKAHDELEVRVRERTRELAEANRSLEAEIAERTHAEEQLRRANRALRLLAECNQVLVRAGEEQRLLDGICLAAVELGDYRIAWVGRAEQDEARTIRPIACAGCRMEDLARSGLTWEDSELGRGPAGTAIRTGHPAVVHDILSGSGPAAWSQEIAHLGVVAAVGVPLVVEGRIFGAFTIYSTDAHAFDDAQIRLLQELADDLAFGLASLRLRQQRQRALEALQASEVRYRRIVETAEEGIWMVDAEANTTFINQKMADMLGYSVEEMLGSPILSYADQRDRAAMERGLQRRRAGIKDSLDVCLRRRDGSDLWVIMAGTPIFDEAGRFRGSLKMLTDITERKHLERSVAEISHLEQQRMGRDLHDVLGQNLTGMSFLSKILEQKLESLRMAEAQDAAEIGRLAALTNKQTRSLARGLAPVDLTAANFAARMKEFAAGIQDIFSISCACECDHRVSIPGDDAAMHLYRIAQEAVNNAVRHGKARNVMIHLTEEAGRGMLIIQDDGHGMPRDSDKAGGMGLRIMRYRAGAVGGQLRVRSNAGRGTIVICSFGGEAGHSGH